MLSVQVIDGSFAKDGSSFADFEYDITVVIDNSNFSLQRNFLDFCELESLLRNTFPDASLPTCHSLETMHSWRATSKSPRSSLDSLRRVTLGSGDNELPCDTYRMSRNRYLVAAGVAPIFTIDRSVADLNTWLQALVQFPYVLKCRTFAMFLCSAIDPYRTLSDHPLIDVSYIDFLLPAKQLKSKQVITKFALPLEVQSGQLVVWRFLNKPYDIFFTVDFNGEYLMDPARYLAAKEHCGCVAVPAAANFMNAGICEGRWENKYNSMMLPSTLQYMYRAAEMSEAEDAKRRAAEKNASIRLMREAVQQMETSLVSHAATVLEQSIQVALDAPLPREGCDSFAAIPTAPSETEHMRQEILTLRKQLRTLRRQYVALQLEKRCSRCKQQELTRGLSEIDDYVVVDEEDEESETTDDMDEEPMRRASSAPELSAPDSSSLLASATKAVVNVLSPATANTKTKSDSGALPDYIAKSTIFSPDALALEFDDWYRKEFGEDAGKVRQTDALGGSGVLHNRLVSWAKRRVSDIFKPPSGDELGTSSSHHALPGENTASMIKEEEDSAPAPHIFDDSGDSDDSSSAEEQTDAEDTEKIQPNQEQIIPESMDEKRNIDHVSTSEVHAEDITPVALETRGEWSRYYSSTDEKDYFFNSATQVNQWEMPSEWNAVSRLEGQETSEEEIGVERRDSRCSSVTEEVTSQCDDSAVRDELQHGED